ncbi:MAG: M50 family metallopeptidase [Candidatus Saccharibacteria bacterium]|nr:M50 family metallopeptidase [Candidatus Saccharibacteria bacterium]
METVIGIIVGLIVLMLLVVGHEFGHYYQAVHNGVRVLEFGIGFPPRAKAWVLNPEFLKWKKKMKKWRAEKKAAGDADKAEKVAKEFAKLMEKKPRKWLPLAKEDWKKDQKTLVFSLNYLPVGGFCQMDGESDSDERPGTFGSASLWQKTKILFGGVAMNWLMAFVILTILAWTGMPHFMENQYGFSGDETLVPGVVTVGEVIEGSPAAEAGFQEGDEILSVNGEKVVDANGLISYNTENAGKEVEYEVKGQECWGKCPECCEEKVGTKKVKLNDEGAEYQLGVTLKQENQALYKYGWSAPVVGAGTTVQLTAETFKGLGQMVVNLVHGVAQQFSGDAATREAGRAEVQAAGDSVSGPVGIIGVLFPAMTAAGATNLAFLAALISVSLACMNVLPIPALDGGRWFLIMFYRLRGKKLPKETEEKIVTRAFIVLLVLMVAVTIMDVVRLF